MTDVTMIIPTRHRAALLETTLGSLLTAASEATRDTEHRVRLLVVDDASEDDDTRHLAERMGVDYLRIDEHDGRMDPGAAIKLGIANVDTEYYSLFGDDDIALPRHFVLAFERLGEGVDVLSSSFHVVDEHLAVRNTVVLRPTGVADIVAGRTALNDGSFVRHALVRDIELDVSLEAHMLPPMWAELMADESVRFAIVEEPSWLYRRHAGNISGSALSERDLELRRRSNEEGPPPRHREAGPSPGARERTGGAAGPRAGTRDGAVRSASIRGRPRAPWAALPDPEQGGPPQSRPERRGGGRLEAIVAQPIR